MSAPEDPFRTPDADADAKTSRPVGAPGDQPLSGTAQPQYQQAPQGQPPHDQPQYGQAPQGQVPLGQGQYGQTQPFGQEQRSPRNGLGVAALVLGILALVLCWTGFGGILFGLIAIPLGLIGRGRAKRGEATNGGQALVGTILGTLGLLVSIGIIVATALFFTSDKGKSLVDCISQAGQDQTAINACQQQVTK